MSIPADNIVRVNPSLLEPGGTDLELNGLFAIDSLGVPPGAVLSFSSPQAVNDYLGATNSIPSSMLQAYFNGYVGSDIKPSALLIARWNSQPSPPYVLGKKLEQTLAELKLITDGELFLSMGGVGKLLEGLDFSAAASLSEVAEIVQDAMRAAPGTEPVWANAVCVYGSGLSAFNIGSTLMGAAAITAPTGDVATAMALQNGTVFLGADTQSPAACMDAIIQQSTNWVSFAAIDAVSQLSTDLATEFAQWSDSKGVRFLFCAYDDNPALIDPLSTDNLGKRFQALGVSTAAAEYGGPEYAGFLMGVGASIDYNRPGGAITTAFKASSIVTFNVTNENAANALIGNGFNFYGDYATANDQFRFHYPGQMFGPYKWVDTYLNAVWLNNALQVALMSGLSTTGRLPYNQKGYTKVRAWMQDPVQRALSNGVIDSDIVLSEAQKTEINQQAGMDISQQLSISGYFIQILDPGPTARAARQSPIINFWYTYGGSIQKLVVASKAIV